MQGRCKLLLSTIHDYFFKKPKSRFFLPLSANFTFADKNYNLTTKASQSSASFLSKEICQHAVVLGSYIFFWRMFISIPFDYSNSTHLFNLNSKSEIKSITDWTTFFCFNQRKVLETLFRQKQTDGMERRGSLCM